MYEMLDNGDNIWVAPEDQITPHLEVKFARDEFDRASLQNAITARVGNEAIPIGPVELANEGVYETDDVPERWRTLFERMEQEL